ncbi:hypothetical protein ACWGUN_18020 [Streptomyces koyangensis]
MLGFTRTCRHERPNPYVVVDDIAEVFAIRFTAEADEAAAGRRASADALTAPHDLESALFARPAPLRPAD